MLTRKQFVEKYNGKFVEVAGSPGAKNQCVDLANAYLREVLGHPIVEHTNARDFPSKLPDFKWIVNTPEAVPEPGDLVIWQNDQYGHISIFLDGDVKSFNSFDQNYPLNTPAHIQRHTYLRPKVAGWLRPKKANMSEELDACMKDRAKFWKERDEAREKLEVAKKQVSAQKGECTKKDKEIFGLKLELTDALNKLKEKESKPVVEAVKEPLRYVVFFLVGTALTWAYAQFPFLGEMQPDQQLLTVTLTGLVLRGLDKLSHEYGKNTENKLLIGGLTRF